MKVLLLDADGVVLKKGEYFSKKFAYEHGLAEGEVMAFFKNEFGGCQKGELDLKEEIIPYLEKWRWTGSVEDFLEYWFAGDVLINNSIVSAVESLKNKDIKCYLASNNEKYRAERIKKVLDDINLLDGYYFSSGLKLKKSDPLFFNYILQDLKVDASEVIYLDNDEVNLESARSLGIESHLYSDEKMQDLVAKYK